MENKENNNFQKHVDFIKNKLFHGLLENDTKKLKISGLVVPFENRRFDFLFCFIKLDCNFIEVLGCHEGNFDLFPGLQTASLHYKYVSCNV